MEQEIKIDLSRATIGDFVKVLSPNAALVDHLCVLDKTIEGGIMHRSQAELPAILAAYTKALSEQQETIGIAMLSMRRFLDGEDGEGEP